MGDQVEARPERVCRDRRRPHASGGEPLEMNAGNTVRPVRTGEHMSPGPVAADLGGYRRSNGIQSDHPLSSAAEVSTWVSLR
jgi:hypothetical protein